MNSKICSKCKTEKPISTYIKHRSLNGRQLLAHSLRQEGKKFKEIGEIMNVSTNRGRQLYLRAEEKLVLREDRDYEFVRYQVPYHA